VDMWTIGVVDGLRFPGFPNELGKRGNAGLAHTPASAMTAIGASEPTSKPARLHLKKRLRPSHDRGPPQEIPS
jgi:hypothetical protein